MARGRIVLVTLAAATLVAACSDAGSTTTSDQPTATSTPRDATSTSSISVGTTSSDTPATTIAPATTVPVTTAAPVTPAPSAAPPPQPVATAPQSAAPRVRCQAASDPPPDAAGLQAALADIDDDQRFDAVWLYDAPNGTHLHVRTGRGQADDIVLPFGHGAVAVGATQVDLAVGAANPGLAQEILAVTSDGDGRRLVGVYGFALNTGCLETFAFDEGSPFVYLVNQTGNRSGLRCVSDGVNGHLEALTATPAGADAYSTTRMVFGRNLTNNGPGQAGPRGLRGRQPPRPGRSGARSPRTATSPAATCPALPSDVPTGTRSGQCRSRRATARSPRSRWCSMARVASTDTSWVAGVALGRQRGVELATEDLAQQGQRAG